MTIYLTIITTVLVLTQVIRITQNHIQLRRDRKKFDESFSWLKKNEVTEQDFETQKAVYRLLRERLEQDARKMRPDEDINAYIDRCEEGKPCKSCYNRKICIEWRAFNTNTPLNDFTERDGTCEFYDKVSMVEDDDIHRN